jgi:hypothetical protein
MFEEHQKQIEKLQENELVYQREIERLIEERNQARNLLSQRKEEEEEEESKKINNEKSSYERSWNSSDNIDRYFLFLNKFSFKASNGPSVPLTAT